jgi:hypothetical protein
LAVSAHLHNVRALSNEKLGNYKNVSSDYLHAAQIMEKIDVSSSIVFWKNLKSFLVEQNLTSDTSAVDKRITLLENVVKNEKWQEQLAPRVSLEISKSSVKQ